MTLSPWLKLMLEEIERKSAERARAQAEQAARLAEGAATERQPER